jgi:hypothetical protein
VAGGLTAGERVGDALVAFLLAFIRLQHGATVRQRPDAAPRPVG